MPTIDFSINDDDDNDDDDDDSDDDDDDDGGGKDCKYGILSKVWWKYDGGHDAIDDDNDIGDSKILAQV